MMESVNVDARLERGVRARGLLVAAAKQAFSALGYPGVSLAVLAQEIGLAKSTVLHHFASKDRLYDAVLEDVAASLLPLLESLRHVPHADAAVLARIAVAYFDWARAHPQAANLLSRELLDNSERAARAKRWHLLGFTRRVTELIELGQQAGHLRSFHAELAVEMMLGYAQFHVAAAPTRVRLIGRARARAYEAVAAKQWANAMARAFAA